MRINFCIIGLVLGQQEGSGAVDYDYGEDAEKGKLKKQEQEGYSAPTYNYQSYETPTYQYSDDSYYGRISNRIRSYKLSKKMKLLLMHYLTAPRNEDQND